MLFFVGGFYFNFLVLLILFYFNLYLLEYVYDDFVINLVNGVFDGINLSVNEESCNSCWWGCKIVSFFSKQLL